MTTRLRRFGALFAVALLGGLLAPVPAGAATGDKIIVVTGDSQTIFPNGSFAPLVLKIVNSAGQPIANRSVQFEVLGGLGNFSGRRNDRSLTGADGKVTMPTLSATGRSDISFRATAESPSYYFTFHVVDTLLTQGSQPKQVVAAGARFDPVAAHFGYSTGYTRSGVRVDFTASGDITFAGGARTAYSYTNTYGDAFSPDIPALSGAGVGAVTAITADAPAIGFVLKSVSRPVIRASGSGVTLRSGQRTNLSITATDEDGLPVKSHRVSYAFLVGGSAVTMRPNDGISTSSDGGYSEVLLIGNRVTTSTTVAFWVTSALMTPVTMSLKVVP